MRGSDSVNFSKSVETTKTSKNPQQNTPKRNWSVSYKICKKCFLLKITFQMHFPQRVATYILRDYFCHNSQKTNNVRLWRNIPVFRCWCQMSLWLWYYYAAVSAIKHSGRSELDRGSDLILILKLQSQDLIQAKSSGTQSLTSFISIYSSKLNVFILETSWEVVQ